MIFWENTVAVWANTVVFWESTVIFGANTVVLVANTVLFGDKHSGIWGQIKWYLGENVMVLCSSI